MNGSVYPLVTVLILNWNRRNELLIAIESVLRQTYKPIEILVVDNASSDGSVDAVVDTFPSVNVVSLDKNYGCPGGRNRGVPHSSGDFIFYMDNDAVLHRRAVEIAYRTICCDKRIGVVGGAVKLFSSIDEIDTDCFVPDEERTFLSVSFHGGISLHRTAIYGKVGMYPDDYMYGAEEGNLGIRLIEKGYIVVTNPAVILWHARADSRRNKTEELIRRQTNTLVNRLSLWPEELALIYLLKTLLKHPYQAIRFRVVGPWLRKWPLAWIRAIVRGLQRREPLSRKTIILYNTIKSERIPLADDSFMSGKTYARCIMHAIFEDH